ncbi:hypothetical protein H9Q69_005701 [Fusarium xylarioides]|nr:hypothetical protein H9Q69_005701 [Fusarium xylarioides]
MSGQQIPDVSMIDYHNSGSRNSYLLALSGAINHFDCQRYEALTVFAYEKVCAEFERDGLVRVGAAYYLYKYDVTLWDMCFGNLGNDAPACPWAAHSVNDDLDDEPAEDYSQWRLVRGFADACPSEMDVSNNDDTIRQDAETAGSDSTRQLSEQLAKQTKRVAEFANENAEMAREVADLIAENKYLRNMLAVVKDGRVWEDGRGSLEL